MDTLDYAEAYQSGFTPTVRFLKSKGAPQEAAEETAQAAWTVGWERIGQLRNTDVLRTWVNSIALNLYRRAAKRESRKKPLLDRTGGAGVDLAAIDLASLLESCCPADRNILLHQLHGLTTTEIAQKIGATETAARLRLMRARRAIRSLTRRASPAAI